MGIRRLAVVTAILATALLMANIGATVTNVSAAPPPSAKSGPLTPALQALANPGSVVQSPGPLSPLTTGPGSIQQRPGGRILVEIRVTDTSPATLALLRAAGAQPVNVNADIRVVTADVLPADLNALAAVQPQVLSVQAVLQPLANVATCPTGLVSEGDTQLLASTARTNYSVNGAGVTVGILSDSYNRFGGAATDVADGELPGVGNTCGFTTPVTVQSDFGSPGGDEARAMAQIVHDIAPGANLRVGTAFIGESDFADQIRAMAQAGAKVIVDDVTYFAEPIYQDGLIAKAVEDVVSQGVTYFSSAANSNKIVAGNNISSYETLAYRPATCPATVVSAYATFGSPVPLTCHDFDPGIGVDTTYSVTFNGTFRYLLGWNEPQFGITSDYDLLLLNHTTGAILLSSVDTNNGVSGTQRAFEFIGASAIGTYDLVVVRFDGATNERFKLIALASALTGVEYPVSAGGDVVGPTIFGHNATRSGASVAAVAYNNSAAPETYSSRGPATWCWGPVVGTTPAAALPSCVTATVDLAATDGGQLHAALTTSFLTRFFGTSAAAPHAAAIAALMLQYRACLAPSQVLATLQSTAVAVGAFGVNDVGAGLLNANAALGAVPACATATDAGNLKAAVLASGAVAPIPTSLATYLTSAQAYLAIGTPTMKAAACNQLKLFKAAVVVAMQNSSQVAAQGPFWIAQADVIRAAVPCLPPN